MSFAQQMIEQVERWRKESARPSMNRHERRKLAAEYRREQRRITRRAKGKAV